VAGTKVDAGHPAGIPVIPRVTPGVKPQGKVRDNKKLASVTEMILDDGYAVPLLGEGGGIFRTHLADNLPNSLCCARLLSYTTLLSSREFS